MPKMQILIIQTRISFQMRLQTVQIKTPQLMTQRQKKQKRLKRLTVTQIILKIR